VTNWHGRGMRLSYRGQSSVMCDWLRHRKHTRECSAAFAPKSGGGADALAWLTSDANPPPPYGVIGAGAGGMGAICGIPAP
jgi:hypothetical protein